MSEGALVDLPPCPAVLAPGQALVVEKTPPRPAPTIGHSWREYNPRARLLYIRDRGEANFELAKLGSSPQALGFDLEWKPTFIRGAGENRVALVQLANNDTIFLLQITAMQDFPERLSDILANPLIVKAGVAIQNDAKKLYNDWQVPMYNCVDLSLLARTVDNARWQGKYNASLGLARLIESYEYRLMEKGKINRSNWEAHLNAKQLEYASNDAHAGHVIYRKLESMMSYLQDPPESVWYSFNLVSGRFLTSDGLQWHANNPNYDPGPPPPPRLPRATADISGAEAQNKNQVKSGAIPHRKNRGDRGPKSRQSQHPNLNEHRPRNLPPTNPSEVQAHSVGASGSGSNHFQAKRPQHLPNNYNRGPHTPYLPAHASQAHANGGFPTAAMGPSAQFHKGARASPGFSFETRRSGSSLGGPTSRNKSGSSGTIPGKSESSTNSSIRTGHE